MTGSWHYYLTVFSLRDRNDEEQRLLTRVEGTDETMVLKIVSDAWQIKSNWDFELVQQCSGTEPRQLKKLGRMQSSGGDDDFSSSIHCLTWCGGIRCELVMF